MHVPGEQIGGHVHPTQRSLGTWASPAMALIEKMNAFFSVT
jgi:hypothetical protein